MRHLCSLLASVALSAALITVSGAETVSLRIADLTDRSGYTGKWDIGRGISAMMRDEFPSARYNIVFGSVSYCVSGTVREFTLSSRGFASYAVGGYQDYSAKVALDLYVTGGDGTRIGNFTAKGDRIQRNLGLSLLGGPVGDDGYQDELNRLWNLDFDSKEFRNTILGQAIYDAINNAVPRISSMVLKKPYGLRGEVVKARGKKIYLNIGSDDGVEIGQDLTVYCAETELNDPKTGKYIGNTPKARIGHAGISAVNGPHLSEAEIKGTDAGGGIPDVKEGDYAVME